MNTIIFTNSDSMKQIQTATLHFFSVNNSLGKIIFNTLSSFILFFMVMLGTNSFAQQLAFPSAEGFGKNTTGGRGGKLYIVNNLNDSGPGSLREAVQASGTRTIVFSVSGIIRLQSQLTISNDNISILGHSAPGDGICIANYTVQLSADNIIIRYIRFRPGSFQQTEYDASWGRNNKDIILDHCSYSWGNDEQASFYDNANFTMQYCIISESFYASDHPKGNHGYGGIWGGMGASFHHNLIANHTSRTPRFCGARYHLATASSEIVDFRNNVIFNWGFNSAYGGEAGNYNMVNNYYKPGAATSSGKIQYRIINPSDTKADGNPISKWYITGNYITGNASVTTDNWNGGVQPSDATITLNQFKLTSPIASSGIATQSATDAYANVLATAGASFKRDAVDLRTVNATQSGITKYGGAFGANKGIIDNENQVGGFPAYNTYNQITDADKDGMDDLWEKDHGMAVGTKDDAGDTDGDGYTNIEEYLNCLIGEGNNCDVVKDCNGDVNGTASLDDCGVCTGGKTGKATCTGSIQGEDFCEAIAVQESSNLGFIATGYVNFDNVIGSSGTWYLNSKTTKTASVGFRFANGGTTARSMNISVNGTNQKTLTASPTGSWTTWNVEYQNLNLTTGVNKIEVTATSSDGGPNLDLIVLNDTDLTSGGCSKDCNGIIGGSAFIDNCNTCVSGNTGKVACAQDCEGNWGGTAYKDNCDICISTSNGNMECSGFMEAENACAIDGILLEDKNIGFSGSGYVNADNTIGAGATWSVTSTSAQTVTLSFRYANGGTTSRDGDLYVNGTKITNIKLPATGAWTTWEMASVNIDLEKGANEIILNATTADGLANIDLISFSEGVSEGLCVITGIHSTSSSEISIYPNPTNDRISWNTEKEWILMDIQGKELAKGKGISANLSTLPNGIYYLKIDQSIKKIFKK